MIKRLLVLFVVMIMAVMAVCATPVAESTSASSIVVTDMIGRQVEVVPGTLRFSALTCSSAL